MDTAKTKTESAEIIRKTIVIKLRSEAEGDLNCIDGMLDADGEPIVVQFGAEGSMHADCDMFADDAQGTVTERLTDALEADDNVESYTVRTVRSFGVVRS